MRSGFKNLAGSIQYLGKHMSVQRFSKIHEWKGVGVEVLKWGWVLFLFWPLFRLHEGKFSLIRILAGIVFFVIFSGKLLYDTLVQDYIRRRNVSRKRDLITFLGIILAASLIVGFVVFVFALYVLQLAVELDPIQQSQ
jgi:hypothetical protein